MVNELKNIPGSCLFCAILLKVRSYLMMKLCHAEVAQEASIDIQIPMSACFVMKVNTKTMITMMVGAQRLNNVNSVEQVLMHQKNWN